MTRPGSSSRRLLAAAAVVLGAAVWQTGTGEAHKAITSKYHFNEDVFPLVRDRCGRCHVDGGVAPMSLMTYDDAAPWAESLRLELLAEETPPWHPLRLSARETDMLLVWATGGAPRGSADKAPPPVALVNEWGSGEPDATLSMPKPFVLAGAVNEDTLEATWMLPKSGSRAINAIDLLPGTPAIVRSATLLLKTSDGTLLELGTWLPGRGSAVPLAVPVKVGDGAALVARILYKRTWKYEGQDLSDKSAVGLYFTATDKKSTGARAPAPRR
jgi:hypothetical protein